MDSIGRLARYRLQLYELDFGVIHCAVLKQQASDALSLLQPISEPDTSLEGNLSLHAIDTKTAYTSILVISAKSNNMILLKVQDIESIDTPPTLV